MRYFVKNLESDPWVNLYRFEIGKSATVEEYWLPSGWKLDLAAELVEYLVLGEGNFGEVSVKKAQKMFPQAFIPSSEPNCPTMKAVGADIQLIEIPGDHKNLVVFSGSSIDCLTVGIELVARVETFLNQKSAEGKLKCFKWWCEECVITPLVSGGDPTGHVIKISIPNILKLIDGVEVNWQWKDPDSEWARNHGTAANVFQEIIAKKSRPSWVVLLAKPQLV
jgi:hypothetical protein